MPNTHYRACNLCEAICGLEIETREGEVLSIKGDPGDPLSRGHICPKAVAMKDIQEDPDRLRTPVRRTAGGWAAISWEEAFDEVVSGIKGVQERYGNDAMGLYLGNPNVHNSGSMLMGPFFLRALRTRNRYSATSADQLPHHFAALFMFGHYLAIPVPDVDRTDYLLILGANPLVSNGSLMTAPGMSQRLRALQERGGRCIVIDPRRTQTAKRADEHHFIRPGSDVFFLLGLIHTLFEEDLVQLGRLGEFTMGVETLQEVAAAYPPAFAASRCGIPEEAIRRLAREFAGAESAVCYGRMGLSTQQYGGLCNWLINALNILTGNLDRPGGAMFTLPAFDLVGQRGAAGKTGTFGRWKSRIRGLPEFGGELPVSELVDEITTPGEGQIRGMLTVAGNPVLSTPSGHRLDEAIQQLEFMVAIDIYINETTRHADIILPPTTGLETTHYDIIFHIFGVRNTTRYNPAVFERSAEQRHDWEIYRELYRRFTGEPDNQMTPDQLLAMGLQYGPYAGEGLTLDKIKSERHGIDLGPLQACLPDRLFTADKKIHLAPEAILKDLSRLDQAEDTGHLHTSRAERATGDLGSQEPENGQLLLIGRRELRSNNSWMHNCDRLVKGPDRCTLMIHPTDADARGIKDGGSVTIRSRVGAITLPAEVTTDIMPGVVSIPHGYGHKYEGIQMETAARHAGASINDLTDYRQVDELTGNAAFNGIGVEVSGDG